MKCRCLLSVLVWTALGCAQSLQFEAASVRAAVPPADGRYMIGCRFDLGRFNADYTNMQDLIQNAYPYKAGQQIIGPGWINSRDPVYNIAAKASGPATIQDLRVMLQHLLEQRFGLQLHTRERPAPAYALVTTAKGFHVAPVQFDGPDWKAGYMHPIPNGVEFRHASMKGVANYLSWLGRRVADETGIDGLFDFNLTFATRGIMPVADPAIDSDQPSIFTALEKIGLKLENRQGTVTDYIIDHVERTPSEN